MPRSEPCPVAEDDAAHWCIAAMIQSTESSPRPAASVQQVEQRLEGLDGLDRVGALAVGEHPAGIGRGQVAEAGEAGRCATMRGGAAGGAERIAAVGLA